jgi:solute carrier family 45 protein 1/2/4
VQPCVGVISDTIQSRLGKRIPILLFGCVTTTITLLALPRTDSIIKTVNSKNESSFLIGATAACIFILLNVSMQPLQCAIRTLAIDCCPPGQHSYYNAWISRSSGLGTIISYTFSTMIQHINPDPGFGFKSSSAIATAMLNVAVLVLVLFIREPSDEAIDSLPLARPSKHMLDTIRHSMAYLSNSTRLAFGSQFFSWLAWFPFLYYVTS